MKSSAEIDAWTGRLREALAGYEVSLLRQVGDKLLRLRNKPEPAELIDKVAAFTANSVAIDRRLQSLPAGARGVLALIHRSRQPCWPMQGLIDLLSCLEVVDGSEVVRGLFECGLLLPQLPEGPPRVKSFQDWLGRGAVSEHRLFVHPLVSARAAQTDQSLAKLPTVVTAVEQIQEGDGLDIFLRLGVLWQQVKASPFRLTQQGEFFKRDEERLTQSMLLGGALADAAAELPHTGPFLVALALALGILRAEEGQLVAGVLPEEWNDGLVPALGHVLAMLPELTAWNAERGWLGLHARRGPHASAGLVALAILARLSPKEWLAPADIGCFIAGRHCAWRGPEQALDGWSERFLLGLAPVLRLVQWAVGGAGQRVVRLSAVGRALLGVGSLPSTPELPKTLLVQPNLEIVAYRQGLTPGLIATLTRFADWNALGAACTLQLVPASVYRGLETGCSFEQILQTLEQSGVRELPDSVLHSLRTWADKRERLAVCTAAALLEFNQPEDLEMALARGLPGTRVAERFLLVPREEEVDYRHLRLTSSRDYGLPPGQCVELADDGVTLTVELAKADLLLESEIDRFAECAPGVPDNGRLVYRLTPGSLRRGRDSGLTLATLENWFPQRAGQPLSPAARLLFGDSPVGLVQLGTLIVLQVPTAELADGLMQWPQTGQLIQARLGPQALVVAEEHVAMLRSRLAELRLDVPIS